MKITECYMSIISQLKKKSKNSNRLSSKMMRNSNSKFGQNSEK